MKYLLIMLLLVGCVCGREVATEEFEYIKTESKLVSNYNGNEMIIMDDTLRNITCYKVWGLEALTCVNRECTDSPKSTNNDEHKKGRYQTFDHMTALGYKIYYVSYNGKFSLVEKNEKIYLMEHNVRNSPEITNESFMGYTGSDY